MRDLVGHAGLVDGAHRIAAANNRNCRPVGCHGMSNRVGPHGELRKLKTPAGPFHTIVFAVETTSSIAAIDLGPMSSPCQSAGKLTDVSHSCVFASAQSCRPEYCPPAAAASRPWPSLFPAPPSPCRSCLLRPATCPSSRPAHAETCTPCRQQSPACPLCPAGCRSRRSCPKSSTRR